jgi:hypothetical protein
LYDKTQNTEYRDAYQQLQAATSGNEFADAMMSGSAVDRKPSSGKGSVKKPAPVAQVVQLVLLQAKRLSAMQMNC